MSKDTYLESLLQGGRKAETQVALTVVQSIIGVVKKNPAPFVALVLGIAFLIYVDRG